MYLYWILSVVRPLWCGENSKKWVNLCREKMRKCGEMRIGQEEGDRLDLAQTFIIRFTTTTTEGTQLVQL